MSFILWIVQWNKYFFFLSIYTAWNTKELLSAQGCEWLSIRSVTVQECHSAGEKAGLQWSGWGMVDIVLRRQRQSAWSTCQVPARQFSLFVHLLNTLNAHLDLPASAFSCVASKLRSLDPHTALVIYRKNVTSPSLLGGAQDPQASVLVSPPTSPLTLFLALSSLTLLPGSLGLRICHPEM